MASDAARKLLAAPKRTMRTAKQTLENCQENLQTLGNLLQQTVATNLPAAVSRPDLAGHTDAPEPVRGSFLTLGALVDARLVGDLSAWGMADSARCAGPCLLNPHWGCTGHISSL